MGTKPGGQRFLRIANDLDSSSLLTHCLVVGEHKWPTNLLWFFRGFCGFSLERLCNWAVQCHGSSSISQKISLLNHFYGYEIFGLDFLCLEKVLWVQYKKGLKLPGNLKEAFNIYCWRIRLFTKICTQMKMWISCSLLPPKKKHWKITKTLKYAFILQRNSFQRSFTIIYSSVTNSAAYLRSGN